MRYQNPFNEDMSFSEARDILFLELEKTKTYKRFVRLQADYAAVIPSIIRQEINAFRDSLKSEEPEA